MTTMPTWATTLAARTGETQRGTGRVGRGGAAGGAVSELVTWLRLRLVRVSPAWAPDDEGTRHVRPTRHPPRRALLLGALGLAGCTVAAAPPGPTRSTAPPSPAATGPTEPSATAPASATPESAAAVPLPSRDEILAAYASRTATEWGTDVTGVVSTLADVDVAASPSRPQVALTFDACGGGGSGDGYDKALIELLRRESVPATLYLNARWIRRHGGLAAELAADPLFAVACHGTAHVPLSVTGREAYGIRGTDSVGAAYDELTANVGWFVEHLGHPQRSFRPGTAHCDDVGAAIARYLGMPVAGFSVNGDGGATYTAGMVEEALLSVTDADIVLAHMNRPEGGTAEGTGRALPRLVDRGVRFVTLAGAS